MSDRPGTTGATSEWPRPGRCRWARCPHPETLVWADGYCSARCRRQARKAEPGRVPAGHCRMCGEPVYKPAQGPVPDFCSDRCRNRWNRLTRTGTSARPRRSCHECGARLDTGTRGEYCGDACRKAHDYKTARDRRTLRSAANAALKPLPTAAFPAVAHATLIRADEPEPLKRLRLFWGVLRGRV